MIHILSSTDRPDSNAMKVAEYAENIMKETGDVNLFSLMDFPLAEVAGGKYGETPEPVKAFNDEFLAGDGFLFVVPEYNGGFPGILKLFVDYLPFPEALEHVPVSLIGEAAGAFGALRPVEQFEQILKYRKAVIYPERMFIQRVNDNFDPEKGIKQASLQKLFIKQLTGFPGFVERLQKEPVSV